MAIINLCKATDTGAVGHLLNQQPIIWNEAGKIEYAEGPCAYWTRLSHEGVCLKDYERNGYNDSDFHMIVWDDAANEPRDICFASTRGWSYPCYGSWVDATDDVRAKYELYQTGIATLIAYGDAAKRARELKELRAELKTIAHKQGVPYARLLRARRFSWFAAVKRLLSSNVRSGFKLSLRAQVIAWLNDPAPKYGSPLSPKQLSYL